EFYLLFCITFLLFYSILAFLFFFFFQAEDGIRDFHVTGVQTCALPIFMVDATLGWESQDMNIFGLAQKNRKGIVIVVNKWDLVEDKSTNTTRDFENQIKERIGQFTDIPILFVSALTKQRILKAVEMAMEVYENRAKKIKTSKLNEVMLPVFEHTPPPATKGKFVKIKYC